MKNLIFAVLLACTFVACDSSKAQKEKAAANKALIESYLEAVVQKDYNKMAAMLADTYRGYGPSVYDSVNKEQAVEAWKFNSVNVYESIEFKGLQLLPAFVEEGTSTGEWISAWANLELWFKDNDVPVNLFVNTVYKIEGGKIGRSRTFLNQADVMKQLGLPTFPPLFLPDGADLELDDAEEIEDEVEG